ERLGQKGVSAGGAAGLLQPGIVPRRQHDDLDGGVIEPAADLHAVDARHHHVKDDDGRVSTLSQLKGLFAVSGFNDFEVVDLENGAQQPTDHLVVIDDHHDPPGSHRSYFNKESTLASPVLYRRTSSSCKTSMRSCNARR